MAEAPANATSEIEDEAWESSERAACKGVSLLISVNNQRDRVNHPRTLEGLVPGRDQVFVCNHETPRTPGVIFRIPSGA